MLNMRRQAIILCAGVGLTLIMVGLIPFIVHAQEETPVITPEPQATLPYYDPAQAPATEPTGDNSYCLICHSQPLQTVTLRDGNILNLYVDTRVITNSVHGPGLEGGPLGCVDCHGHGSFPHNGPTPENQRAYTLNAVTMCVGCHQQEVDELQHGLHERAILAGDTAAAVCTDCHGHHDIQPVENFPELVAGVCGECHSTTLAEWRASAHVDIGPLDCATCHSPHTQAIRGGITANELCLNCHKEMPELWVHTQHTDTESEVGCLDCHMFTGDEPQDANVRFDPGETPTGHTMLLDTLPCIACHEQLPAQAQDLAAAGDGGAEVGLAVTVPASAPAPSAGQGDFVQLLQGLILGLGFGATIAAIFISRGNPRRNKSADNHHNQQSEG